MQSCAGRGGQGKRDTGCDTGWAEVWRAFGGWGIAHPLSKKSTFAKAIPLKWIQPVTDTRRRMLMRRENHREFTAIKREILSFFVYGRV